MPVRLRTWGVIIGFIAVVLIVLSLLFFTRQVQDAPVPTPTGPVPVVTGEVTPEDEAAVDATEEADTDATQDADTETTEAATAEATVDN